MTAEHLPSSNPMSPQLAGLVLRLQEWSRNCLIDGLKMDKGEPTLQALLREAYLILMRSGDSSAVETSVSASPLAQAILDKVVSVNIALFLTSAVDHIEKGGNYAACEVELTDGTKVELRMARKGIAENGK